MRHIELLFAITLTMVVLNGFVYGQDTTLTVTSAGKVGIGTTDPQQKLHVAGGYILANGLGNEQAYIGGDGTGADVQVGSFNSAVTNFAIWNESTKTRMNLFAKDIFAFGNVGIGTTSPAAKLEVADFPALTNDPVAIRISNLRSPLDLFWELRAYDSGSGGPFGRFSIFGGISGGADRLVITTTGNVGIGTIDPGAKLEVAGQVKITEGGPGAGKVLTSDSTGLASWQTPSGGGETLPDSNMQPFLGINFIIALEGIFPSRNTSARSRTTEGSGLDPFIGEIIMFAGNFAPQGWAFCNGQLLPINQNQSLFAILGTVYGGDGRTTFALPDLRGRVPLHPGLGSGLTSRGLGQKGGAEQ